MLVEGAIPLQQPSEYGLSHLQALLLPKEETFNANPEVSNIRSAVFRVKTQ